MPKVLDNVRSDVIKTTRELILSRGYDGVNMRQIAKECKIGLGTIYNYFPSKDDILFQVFDDDWKMLTSDIYRQIDEGMSLREALELVYAAIGTFIERYHSIWHEIRRHKIKKDIPRSGRKRVFKSDIKSLVEYVLSHCGTEADDFTLTTIAILFESYQYRDGFSFDDVYGAVTKLLS